MRTSIFKITLALTLASLAGQTLQAQLPVTNNLKLWLKADALSLADGAAVSSWTDSSPNANHATQGIAANQPTFVTNAIGGYPAVRFDGVNDFLGTTYTLLPNGLTYFAVFRTTSSDATSAYPGNAPLNIIGDNTGGVYNGFGLSNGVAVFKIFEGGWYSTAGTKVLNDNNPHVISVTSSNVLWPNNVIRLYADGTQEAVNTANSYNTTFVAFNRISGGYLNGVGTTDFFSGDLAEVIIYNATLTATERSLVENRLADKYGFSVPEPSICLLTAVALCGILRRYRR